MFFVTLAGATTARRRHAPLVRHALAPTRRLQAAPTLAKAHLAADPLASQFVWLQPCQFCKLLFASPQLRLQQLDMRLERRQRAHHPLPLRPAELAGIHRRPRLPPLEQVVTGLDQLRD